MSRTVYRPPLGLAVRGIGVGSVIAGASLLGYLLAGTLDLSGVPAVIATLCFALVGAVGLVILVVGLIRFAGGGTRLVLDDEGFRNATGPGAGARSGKWKDVRKVQTDGSIVSVDLAGGRQSIIRTEALGLDPRELARDLRTRLQRTHRR